MSFIALLPPELVGILVDFVEPETLPALRLTSQTLCDHATPFLFRDLDFWLEECSLKKLVNIASLPHLAKHVKHISCGMEEFYDVNFNVFKRCVYQDLRTPGAEHDESQQRASYRVYRRYLRRQNDLTSTGAGVFMLAAALASFTALVSMDITDHFCPYLENGGMTPKLLDHEPLLNSRMLTPINVVTPRGGNQLQTLLRALVSAGTILQSFSLEMRSGNIGGSGSLLSALDHREKKLAQAAFMTLRKFHLSLPDMESSAYETDDELSVTSILQASGNLNCLYLQFPHADCEDPPPGGSFRDFFGTCQFTRLQTLIIHGLIVSEGEFRDFLLQSCPELKELRLFSARLTRGSWGSLFQSFRRLPCLDTVDLSHLRYDYVEARFFTMLDSCQDLGPLYDLLCGRSDIDPWPQMVREKRELLDEKDRLEEEEDHLRYRDCTERPPE